MPNRSTATSYVSSHTDFSRTKRCERAFHATAQFAGELLTSPAVLIADMFHRERTLTRRTLIAYFVLLAVVSAASMGYVSVYRAQIESAWTVLHGYEQAAQALPQAQYADEIRLAAAEQGLDPALLTAVIVAESSLRAEVVSAAGARGLMQLLPATWRELRPTAACTGDHPAPACGSDCIYAPTANIRAGASYLRMLLDEFGGNFVAAFAAYNAGASAVHEVDPLELSIPPFPETESYVRQVLSRWAMLRALSPELSPVQRLSGPDHSSFLLLGVSAALWGVLLAWALTKGRRTGHPDALI